jgi:hypothetical protein
VAFTSVAGAAACSALGAAAAAACGAFTGSGAAAFSGLAASVSMLHTISPILRVSPSAAMILMAPACSAFISKVAFSLSNSAITSSLSAHSPSFLSHFTNVTSLMLSPTVGTLISIAMYYPFYYKFGKFRGKWSIFKIDLGIMGDFVEINPFVVLFFISRFTIFTRN